MIRRVLRVRSSRAGRSQEQGVVVVFFNLALCDLSISLLVMPFTAAVLFNGLVLCFGHQIVLSRTNRLKCYNGERCISITGSAKVHTDQLFEIHHIIIHYNYSHETYFSDEKGSCLKQKSSINYFVM